MNMLKTFLLIIGLLCFVAAMFGVLGPSIEPDSPPKRRVNLIAAGLACWIATEIIP
jgi:hypothetical protein